METEKIQQDQTLQPNAGEDKLAVEGIKEFTLTDHNGKTVKVRNTDEAIAAIKEGLYFWRTPLWKTKTEEALAFESTFGVDIEKIRRDANIERLRGEFSENEGRELIYLSSGPERWFENVNNYWYEGKDKDQDVFQDNRVYYRKMHNQYPKTSLEKKLLDCMGPAEGGIGTVLHQEPKDIAAWHIELGDFNSAIKKDPRIPAEFLIDIDSFDENVHNDMLRKASSHRAKISDEFQPKDKTPREYHPLLEPFRDILEQLKKEGATELPEWLRQQGKMAGESAAYQNIAVFLKGWIEKNSKKIADYKKYLKDNAIDNAPMSEYLLGHINLIDKIMILDEKLHRRKNDLIDYEQE